MYNGMIISLMNKLDAMNVRYVTATRLNGICLTIDTGSNNYLIAQNDNYLISYNLKYAGVNWYKAPGAIRSYKSVDAVLKFLRTQSERISKR